MDGATAENTMFNTRAGMLGSQAPGARIAQGEGAANPVAGHLAQGGVELAEGAPVAASISGAKALLAFLKNQSNKEVNAAVAQLAFNPSPLDRARAMAEILRSPQPSRLPMATTPIAAALGRTYPDLTQLPYLNRSDGPPPDAVARQLMNGR